MKSIDIFCASQASTAVCLSMDQASSSSSNTIQLGGRAIDRHNPIIRDSRRIGLRGHSAPCSSQPPIDPKPYQHPQKTKKSSSSKPSKPSDHHKRNSTGHDQKKKGTAENLTEHITNNYSSKPIDSVLRRSWVRPPADLITLPGSSRYLLSDTALLDSASDYDPVFALTPVDEKAQVAHQDESNPASKPSTSSRPKSTSSVQVSFLSVSLNHMTYYWLK